MSEEWNHFSEEPVIVEDGPLVLQFLSLRDGVLGGDVYNRRPPPPPPPQNVSRGF